MTSLVLDGREEHYNIRELNNTVRIVLSQPGWACRINEDYWYISVQDLIDSKWVHRNNYTADIQERKYAYLKIVMMGLHPTLIREGVPNLIKDEDTGPTRPIPEPSSRNFYNSVMHSAPEGIHGENE